MAVYGRENLNVKDILEIDQHMPSEDIWIKLIGEEDKSLNIGANIEIGDKEIQDKLPKLKTNKAAGPDGIFPRVLKELRNILF